jgi:drug/metabolite transporter (DMT)-like permease
MRRASDKRLASRLNHFTIGWSVQLLSLPLIAVGMVVTGDLHDPFSLGADFWLPMLAIWIGFYPLSSYLIGIATRDGELSKIVPLQSFGPVFALLLGWLMLHERPSLTAGIAVAVVVIGAYVLNLKGRYLHNPLKMFTADRPNLFMLLNMVLIAGVAVLDKAAMAVSGPLYFSFVSTVGAVVVLYACARLTGVREEQAARRHLRPLAASGTLFAGAYSTYLLAIHTGPIAYVTTVRSTSILFGAVIGFVYFKESATRAKFAGIGLILAGVMALGLLG